MNTGAVYVKSYVLFLLFSSKQTIITTEIFYFYLSRIYELLPMINNKPLLIMFYNYYFLLSLLVDLVDRGL